MRFSRIETKGEALESVRASRTAQEALARHATAAAAAAVQQPPAPLVELLTSSSGQYERDSLKRMVTLGYLQR